MREVPILFNTEMVKTILEGRKTQTRRLVKARGYDVTGIPSWAMFRSNPDDFFFDVCMTEKEPSSKTATTILIEPPVRQGDILWVRETWQRIFDESGWHYEYKADRMDGQLQICNTPVGWRPSIHMPKEAARLFLRVTTVRVQRLQEITSGEAVAEGIKSKLRSPSEAADVLIAFEELWNRTIKPADLHRYGWSANPWVWVIGFVRVENCAPGAEGG